jgi:hypothetical protein
MKNSENNRIIEIKIETEIYSNLKITIGQICSLLKREICETIIMELNFLCYAMLRYWKNLYCERLFALFKYLIKYVKLLNIAPKRLNQPWPTQIGSTAKFF